MILPHPPDKLRSSGGDGVLIKLSWSFYFKPFVHSVKPQHGQTPTIAIAEPLLLWRLILVIQVAGEDLFHARHQLFALQGHGDEFAIRGDEEVRGHMINAEKLCR